jgi:hypothetical protein
MAGKNFPGISGKRLAGALNPRRNNPHLCSLG